MSVALPSDKIPVERFETKLILPIFVQMAKNEKGQYADGKMSPEDPAFLDRWVQKLVEYGPWKKVEDDGGYPPRKGHYAGPAYAEFCYLHPFVRNFLFVTRDDVRAWWRDPEHPKRKPGKPDPTWNPIQRQGEEDKVRRGCVSQSFNRNLRILNRKDLISLAVKYQMDPLEGSFGEVTTTFDVSSCWLYFFDTQIALLELHLSYNPGTSSDFVPKGETSRKTMPLNLRMVLKLQDIIRRVYSPYWETGSPDWASGEVIHQDSHVPSSIDLTFERDGKTEKRSTYFGNFRLPGNVITADEARDLTSIVPEAVKVKLLQGADSAANADPSDPSEIENIRSAQAHRNYVCDHREPYTTDLWRSLLAPLEPVRLELDGWMNENTFPLRFEQIQDERASLMSYIAVGQPQADAFDPDPSDERRDSPQSPKPVKGIRRISYADWMRLAFVDDQGDSNRYPYSPEFFSSDDSLLGFAYDRFWHPTGHRPAQDDFHSTRWLCSGYGFSAVGDANEPFFTDSYAGALSHFNHHYFALMMIAMFHRVSLLRYKHQLAEFADHLLSQVGSERKREEEFREKSRKLQKELLRFRSIYWFSEVSNQTQAQELFTMFRQHLNLETLYAEVCNESDNAASVLQGLAEERRALSAETLAAIGLLFLMLTPVFDLIKAYISKLTMEFQVVAYVGTILAVFALVGAMAGNVVRMAFDQLSLGFRGSWQDKDSDKTPVFTRHAPAFGLVLGIVIVLGAIFYGSPESTATPEPNGKVQLKASDEIQPQLSGDSVSTDPAFDAASSDFLPSQSQSDSSGSKPNSDETAPQNPNSGSAPPDQDAGAAGDDSTSRSTSSPSPKKDDSD